MYKEKKHLRTTVISTTRGPNRRATGNGRRGEREKGEREKGGTEEGGERNKNMAQAGEQREKCH